MTMAFEAVFPEVLKAEERPGPEAGIGLCLSGGGFRATLFNLGSLWRLNEFGLLQRLTVVTSVSGGSIVSAFLGLKWAALTFDSSGRATNFAEVVAQPMQEFCGRSIAVPAIISGALNPFKSIGDEMAEFFDQLYQGSTLQNLPVPGGGTPLFLVYATSLQSGASVRMAQPFLWDYKVGRITNPTISLARAVAASAAFPPFLSPQVIDTDPSMWQTTKGATLVEPEYRRQLVLTDGGVYDNMGLEAVFDRYQTVLVSDAGAPLLGEAKPKDDWFRMTTRVLDVVTEQTRALRRRKLIDDFKQSVRQGAYWGIRSDVAGYGLPNPMMTDTSLTRSLCRIRTHLDPFSAAEQGHLINWGYGMCDLAIRKWLPGLGQQMGTWPVPEFPL